MVCPTLENDFVYVMLYFSFNGSSTLCKQQQPLFMLQ